MPPIYKLVAAPHLLPGGDFKGHLETVTFIAACMVRRVNAREKFRMKESLRQCIRPLSGEFSPGLDEIRRVPVL
jgi:hypothetical protein